MIPDRDSPRSALDRSPRPHGNGPGGPLCVIGGGIVGLSVAREALRRHPALQVVLLEKESGAAQHQTGRNSGVLHSGLYYAPGSAKARLCTRGKALLEAYCEDRAVPYERCGKVVVATRAEELPHLATLESRASENGVDLCRIGPDELAELEPHATGIAALHVPASGIVDYRAVCDRLVEDIVTSGRGTIRYGVTARATADDGVVTTTGERIPASAAIACAGLHADRVARRSGADIDARIVPFRGEYYVLEDDAKHLVRNLIYPVPDPRFPFLGVHFTRMTDGSIECGPNAVFALAREGYRWRDVSAKDTCEALAWPGTLRLFARHWRTGIAEVRRSFSKRAFVRALQRLVPDIRAEHIRSAPSGVRAQALGRDGQLVQDFAIERHGNALHVLNAPSPAATASLAIAEAIVDRLSEVLPTERRTR